MIEYYMDLILRISEYHQSCGITIILPMLQLCPAQAPSGVARRPN
jgi:hypothetical protein